MEKEIIETYHFNPDDYVAGKMSDGTTFRDRVKDFERDFHSRHSCEYAYNLYANSSTMHLLELSNGASDFLSYGMELSGGDAFNPEVDPEINFRIDKHSQSVIVYGIDSAYMNKFDADGDPIFGKDSGIFPLTLLIDNTMPDGTVRLTTPTTDDDDEEGPSVLIDFPKYEFA